MQRASQGQVRQDLTPVVGRFSVAPARPGPTGIVGHRADELGANANHNALPLRLNASVVTAKPLVTEARRRRISLGVAGR